MSGTTRMSQIRKHGSPPSPALAVAFSPSAARVEQRAERARDGVAEVGDIRPELCSSPSNDEKAVLNQSAQAGRFGSGDIRTELS